MGGPRYTRRPPPTRRGSSAARRLVCLTRGLDARPATRSAIDGETASDGSGPLPHLEETQRVAGQCGVDVEAPTVVLDADRDDAGVPRDADDSVPGVGMESHVVEGFPHDPIQVPLELGLAPRVLRVPFHVQGQVRRFELVSVGLYRGLESHLVQNLGAPRDRVPPDHLERGRDLLARFLQQPFQRLRPTFRHSQPKEERREPLRDLLLQFLRHALALDLLLTRRARRGLAQLATVHDYPPEGVVERIRQPCQVPVGERTARRPDRQIPFAHPLGRALQLVQRMQSQAQDDGVDEDRQRDACENDGHGDREGSTLPAGRELRRG